MRTVLIDGDILIYMIACTMQNAVQVIEDTNEDFILKELIIANKRLAKSKICKKIEKIITDTKSNKAIIAFTSNVNFRKQINPEYKLNRKNVVKPILMKYLKTFVKENFQTVEKEGLEADDVLGVLTTSDAIVKGDKIIWSLDKDFYTIPCKFKKENRNGQYTSVIVTEQMADWYFMFQTLIGDVTDGYSGCPNIGKIKAAKLLGDIGSKSLKEMWNIVVKTYVAQGLSEKEALLNARMARILRENDYDFRMRKVKLWQLG